VIEGGESQPKSSRRLALEALHAADVSGTSALEELEAIGSDDSAARALVSGVSSRLEELDEVIRGVAEHWAVERMPVVDRNLLRLGTFELLHSDGPPGPAINEVVHLAKLLSTEDSGRFVNGVLGKVARERRSAH
jgi:N utilization substance protein B